MLKFDLIDNFNNEDSELYWTHEKRHEDCKSVLDYILTHKNNDSKIKNLKVDQNMLLTLYSVDKDIKTFSDHNVITFEIENNFINRDKKVRKKIKIANRNYSKYDVNLALKDISCNNFENPLTPYNKFIKTLQEQTEKLTKEIYVREITNYKVTKETIAIRNNIRKDRITKNKLTFQLRKLKKK